MEWSTVWISSKPLITEENWNRKQAFEFDFFENNLYFWCCNSSVAAIWRLEQESLFREDDDMWQRAIDRKPL
jgi:hypothetical protein